MSDKNAIEAAFRDAVRELGGGQRRRTGYWKSEQATVVLNLQKSQYGDQYYVNFGVWFPFFEPVEFPTESVCHFRARVEMLGSADQESMFKVLLDLTADYAEPLRREDLRSLLVDVLGPYIEAGLDPRSLLTDKAGSLLKNLIVTRNGVAAIDILKRPVPE